MFCLFVCAYNLVKINNFSVTTNKFNKPRRGKVESNRFISINNVGFGRVSDAEISIFDAKIFNLKHFNCPPKKFLVCHSAFLSGKKRLRKTPLHIVSNASLIYANYTRRTSRVYNLPFLIILPACLAMLLFS